MNLPTVVRYRPYADRTEEETKIRENAKSPWRASYHIEPETGLMILNGFSYLSVSSNFSTKVGHLELLMVWKQWAHTEINGSLYRNFSVSNSARP